MSQKSLSNRLKAIIIGIGICGVVFFFGIVPWLCRELVPVVGVPYMITLVCIWVAAIPCCAVLLFAWRIASNIGRDRSFSQENAALLKRISTLAAVTSAYVFLFTLVLLALRIASVLVVLFAVVILFLGVAVSVAAAALSHLVAKAAELQHESDLTI